MKIIACIEDPPVIKKDTRPLGEKAETNELTALPKNREPTITMQTGLFDCDLK